MQAIPHGVQSKAKMQGDSQQDKVACANLPLVCTGLEMRTEYAINATQCSAKQES